MVQFTEYQNIEKLTRDVAVSLIREVRVVDKNSIEVMFDFDDCYRECLDNLGRLGYEIGCSGNENPDVPFKETEILAEENDVQEDTGQALDSVTETVGMKGGRCDMARKSRKNLPVVMAEIFGNPKIQEQTQTEWTGSLSVQPVSGLIANPIVRAAVGAESEVWLYHAAIYARLSYETEANRERDTVETQIAYLKNFIDRQEDMELADIYADVSFSGTNFERPEFERMMQDIRAGKVDTVITKDLSRLGRNYIDSGTYIERIFPLFHVRYIAVNDDFDTSREGTDLTMPLKNIINEWYARDISAKIRASHRMKW